MPTAKQTTTEKQARAAITAARNSQLDMAFLPEEWTPRAGIMNEGNAVMNVPEGFSICWATSPAIDMGTHYAYLRQTIGYRPVMKDEIAPTPNEEGMYVNFMDEGTEYCEQNGARLMIAPREKLDKLREYQYRMGMEALEVDDEQMRELTENLNRRTGVNNPHVRVSHESSPYNPMSSQKKE